MLSCALVAQTEDIGFFFRGGSDEKEELLRQSRALIGNTEVEAPEVTGREVDGGALGVAILPGGRWRRSLGTLKK